jgi:predicted phage terminase large subunit-like protein
MTPTLTKNSEQIVIEQELLRRELARRKVVRFADYVDRASRGNYLAAHLQLIGQYLDQAIDGTLWNEMDGHGARILAISTPPRHWKSSLISQKAVAYFVGKRATEQKPHATILTSYAASLAEKNSRSALETVRDNPYYQNVFPGIEISRKSQSMSEWSLEGATFPACVAAGVGGGLTGQGADMLVIDDPIKDSSQANSQSYRDGLWEWWVEVARTRINPNGFAVIVMTRWHIDDLIGRLFAQQANERKGNERIVHLRLPALAETEAERETAARMGLPHDTADPLGRKTGAALWPAMYTRQQLAATQRNYPKSFEALYQGRPTPKGGFLLGREQFKMLPEMPTKNVRWVWGTDWAITAKEVGKRDPDYTVVALVGLWREADETRLIIGYIERGQLDQHAARNLVKKVILNAPEKRGVYAGQANMDKIHFNDMRNDPELIGHSFQILSHKQLSRSADKVAKAQPWIERAQAGMVYVIQGPWNEPFFNEVESFPSGLHDDQVDAVSVAVAALGANISGAEVLPVSVYDIESAHDLGQ